MLLLPLALLSLFSSSSRRLFEPPVLNLTFVLRTGSFLATAASLHTFAVRKKEYEHLTFRVLPYASYAPTRDPSDSLLVPIDNTRGTCTYPYYSNQSKRPDSREEDR